MLVKYSNLDKHDFHIQGNIFMLTQIKPFLQTPVS